MMADSLEQQIAKKRATFDQGGGQELTSLVAPQPQGPIPGVQGAVDPSTGALSWAPDDIAAGKQRDADQAVRITELERLSAANRAKRGLSGPTAPGPMGDPGLAQMLGGFSFTAPGGFSA